MTHYKVEITTTARKGDIRKALLQHLVDEEIVSNKEYETAPDVELKKLELKERERESQLRIKELEIRECELSIQLELKVARIVASEMSNR